jgi:DNA-binding transcriptional ArsR family regulator
VDPVFRALADPTRRALLDELFARDGQTLVSLTARHDMTRIAVAKHLKILEDAGLIVSRRRGREKLHYLNPVPIRLVHDRWVSKYAEPWAAGLVGMKHELEDQMEKVFEIYIRTTPERLWEAITDPAIRAKYQFGAAIESDWTVGSPYRLGHPAAERPLICLIDDEQWLDRASAQALGFAARRLAADPVGVVFAARDPGPEMAGLPGNN